MEAMMLCVNHRAPAGLLLALAMVLLAGCQPPDYSAELKPIVDVYVQAWNTGNLDGLDEIIDAQFVRHASPASPTAAVGLDSLKQAITSTRAAYPDFNVVMDEEIYSADRAVGRWTWTGTNTGTGAMPPTGRSARVSGISVLHFAEGRILAEWVSQDYLDLYQQLGFTLVPPESM
jgi:predicted ester cyclase